MIIRSHSALTALIIPPLVSAIWPFDAKNPTAEALIDAGSLGSEGIDGRVVAVGDWNEDKNTDLFVLSGDSRTLQIYLWNRDLFRYDLGAEYKSASKIVNVVSADFDQDGRLDVLLMYGGEKNGWWGGEADTLGMEVILGADGGLFGEKWKIPSSSSQQPLIFDANGSLRPSLLGFSHTKASSTGSIQAWVNDGSQLIQSAPPLDHPERACVLANPHSSAFVDIDGDCIPDLVLHCLKPKSTIYSIQIWLNQGVSGYKLARTYDMPKGSGPFTFADMNRDGTIDIVFPTCSKVSSSTGQGSDCSINIAYNRQVPVCSYETSQSNKDGSLKCRGWGELCTADPSFSFSFEADTSGITSDLYTSQLSTILGNDVSLLLHPPSLPHIPLPLRPGDYNVDGYPDILMTIVDPAAKSPGGVFASKEGSQAHILQNVPCSRGLPGCGEGEERTFVVGQGKGWEALEDIWDVTGASWVDVDDDGSLDIMLQRSGAQGAGKVSFVRNNFYHDAFFLKAQVLNGACDKDCIPSNGGKPYSPARSTISGATYKFTVLDTFGRRQAQTVGQTPQSGYQALDLPYAYIGLGRTNNYIERLTVGVSLQSNNLTNLDSIIPNSHLIINPPHPSFFDSPIPNTKVEVVQNRPKEWRTELYLHPGDWVPYVAAAVLGTVIILAGVVFGLNEREKREDEKERRRALHAINFQAL